MNYFTDSHFDLLDRWQGKRHDNSDPEQNRAYEELKAAYAVTEDWAREVKKRLFPVGRVEVIKRPTNQANNFDKYTWAKIYPYEHAPGYLAYTVGIDPAHGFQVKIDTVRKPENPSDSSPVRRKYEELRGAYDNSSPMVSLLPKAEGLAKTLPELVEWTVQAFQAFRLSYDNVWAELDGSRIVEDEELLQRFDGKPQFAEFRSSWTPEETALFCRLARAVHYAGLDWWHVNIDTQVRCGRRNPDADAAVGVLAVVRGRQTRTIRFRRRFGEIQNLERQTLTEDIVGRIEASLEEEPDFPNAWQTERPGLWPDQMQAEEAPPGGDDEDGEEQEVTEVRRRVPLNTILFGPPGTGKTYATVTRCLEICDGRIPDEPEEIRARYGQLLDEGRIEFVTFHQSYGYEEFVEGIRPDSNSRANGDAGVQLRVKPGILRRTAEKAQNIPGVGSRRVFKMSLGDPKSWRRGPAGDPVFAECIDSGYALLEFGGDIDWSHARYDDYRAVREHWNQEKNPDATVHDTDIQAIWRFRIEMRPGDIVVVSDGYRQFRAVGEITGEYEFRQRDDGFHHRRAVKWHWHVGEREGDPVSVFMEGRFHWRPVVLMKSSNLAGLGRYLGGIDGLVGALPHVLVIDEINRANISKVMGELITLLEEDKRDGAENEVAVTLPYSGERFTLPANLHILGTMNTADRSIAMLDTALRRRFHFEEMSPKPEVLKDAQERTGVDLLAVLRAMNQRLEYLVDRDHLIGHAWFMDAEARDDVDAVMRHKIIPLIAEYFYDDWSKVRAVLGGTDHFVERCALPVPPNLENGIGEERYGWTVQARFPEDAYEALVGAVDPPEGAE